MNSCNTQICDRLAAFAGRNEYELEVKHISPEVTIANLFVRGRDRTQAAARVRAIGFEVLSINFTG